MHLPCSLFASALLFPLALHFPLNEDYHFLPAYISYWLGVYQWVQLALGGACPYKFAMLGKAGVTNPLKTRTVLMRLGMDVTKAKRWVSSELAVAVK